MAGRSRCASSRSTLPRRSRGGEAVPVPDVGRRSGSARRAPDAARSLEEAAPLFAALGDETRLRLVARLCDGGPMSITRLAEGSDVTRQGVTKHLRVMERARLG